MRRPLGLLLAAAVALAVPLLGAPQAVAAETYTAAADGSFAISGRGYGHGRGMSQWGAYGAAQSGLSPAQILSFYYPGTMLTGQPNSPIDVTLSKAQSGQVAVDPAPGLALTWSGGVLALPSSLNGVPVTGWRLRNTGGLIIDARTGSSTWTQYSVVPGGYGLFGSSTTNVRLVAADGTRTEYRGAVGGRVSGSSVQAYNSVPMETYLRSVVPSEMPPSWHPNALAAQSIAARTYASLERYSATGTFDTCDTTSCQVYNGVAKYSSSGALIARYENSATDSAIAATANQVLITGGAYSYAFTQFSAANGGYTVAGNKPYLVAKADPYDGVVPSTSHSWDATISQSALRSAYPGIGAITSLTIVARDGNGEWGGRIESIKITGTSGSSTVTGSQFRMALGLKSTWWTVKGAPGGGGGSGGGGTQPTQIAGGMLLDVTGDGNPDMLGRHASTGQMWIYPGTASGGFGYGAVVSYGWQGFDSIVMPGDLTGDGVPEIYARERSSGILYLYTLNRQGVPTSKTPAGGAGWNTINMIIPIGDVTADGVPDVYGREASTGDLYLYRGAAGGGFLSKKLVNNQWNILDAVLGSGDHNGDGLPDLLARNKADGTLVLYTTGPGGSITSRRTINAGWQMFDALVVAPLGAQSRIYGRNASVQGGALSMYPVNGAGAVQPPTSAGYGWSIFDTLL